MKRRLRPEAEFGDMLPKLFPIFPPQLAGPISPIIIRVLVVTDDNINFGYSYFGLSSLLRNLAMPTEPFVRFIVFPAHRSFEDNGEVSYERPPSMNIKSVKNHFRFKEDIALPVDWGYDKLGIFKDFIDQVWLIGKRASDPLDEEEQELVHDLMDKGVGVFATGDHATLGASLSREVKRVKHMRAWRSQIPDSVKERRISSIAPGWGLYPEEYYELQQYDDEPLFLDVRRYHQYQRPHPLRDRAKDRDRKKNPKTAFDRAERRQPHPVLSARSSKDKVINVLPDHAHEGQVVVPTPKLWEKIMETNSDDFPADFNAKCNETGFPWEVIASSTNYDVQPLANRTTRIEGLPNEPEKLLRLRRREYGVIGVYNGFLARAWKDGHGDFCTYGRIVVDSSFHHFIDANLLGQIRGSLPPENVADPRFRLGFRTPEGRGYLKEIVTYHRNIALWLIPLKHRPKIVATALWMLIPLAPLSEFLDLENMEDWQLGRATIANLGPLFGETEVRTWWTYLLNPNLVNELFDTIELPFHIQLEILDDYALGGAIKALMRLGPHKSKNHSLEKIMEAARSGAKDGLASFREGLERYNAEEKEILSVIKAIEASDDSENHDKPGSLRKNTRARRRGGDED